VICFVSYFTISVSEITKRKNEILKVPINQSHFEIKFFLKGFYQCCGRIHTGFNADPDPDPAFYLNVDPYPDPGQTLKSQAVEFLHAKCTGT
jgi:hypothetical protein